MTICGNCIKEHGYDHDKVSQVQVVATDPIDGTTYWFGVCDNCGGWTEPCLTPYEAKARIGKGMFFAHDVSNEIVQPERTCRNTQSDFDFMCSECGKCVDNGRAIGINYCPRCGRKVEA